MQETFVVFEVAGTSYAVPSEQVVMLEMVESITHVPNAPPFVDGVIVVRGQIIPVVNVRRRFRMEPIPLDMRARLMVIRLDERNVGMLVDTAREFVRISRDQIHPAEGLTGPGVEYLEGVAALPNRLILLVRLDRLLSFEERQTLAEQDDSLSRPVQQELAQPAEEKQQKDSEKPATAVDAATRKRSRKG